MKTLIRIILTRKFLLLLQFIVSSILCFFVYRLNILPMKYFIYFIIGLLILLLLMLILMKPKYKKIRIRNGYVKKRYRSKSIIIGKLISFTLSIVMIFGSVYLNKANSSITNISGDSNSITTRYNVYALKKQYYDTINDLNNSKIANLGQYDKSNYNEVNNALKKKITFTSKNYESYKKCINDLFDKKINAVVLNGYYENIFKRYRSDWKNYVEILWSYDIKEEASSKTLTKNLSKDTFSIYLTGVDTRENSVTATSRSDSNMIITVSPKTKQVLLTGVPRDYYVSMACGSGIKDKLTHAALFGTMNSYRTIEKELNIDLDYYLRVNFQSLIKVVDALGGVRVYSDKAFTPWTNRKVKIKKGWQQMDGATALAFARERKVYSEGDRHRSANQQAVLKAVLNKMLSTQLLTNYDNVMNALEGLFQTNIPSNQIKQLLNYQIKDNPSWDIQSYVLKGTNEKLTGGFLMPNTEIYYMIPDENSIEEFNDYIKAMKNNEKITVDNDESLTE